MAWVFYACSLVLMFLAEDWRAADSALYVMLIAVFVRAGDR